MFLNWVRSKGSQVKRITLKKNTDQGIERITQQYRTNFDTPVKETLPRGRPSCYTTNEHAVSIKIRVITRHMVGVMPAHNKEK